MRHATPPTADFDIGFGLFGPVALPSATAPPPQLSIAVLPFVTIGDSYENSLIADGITDNLITDLAQISGTMVIGRSTMFTYRGRTVDARQVGHELKVRYVVAGSVRAIGKQIIIHVELVDTHTRMQYWSERIDHLRTEWPIISDIVSRRIARSLNLELMNAGSKESATVNSRAPRAVELAMRGWVELFIKKQTSESNTAALRWLNEALAIDHTLPLAWTGVAYATYRAASFGWADYSFHEGMRRAVDFAHRAIELDPRAADAYYAMGQSLNSLDELERAEEAHRTCIQINPSHAPAYAALGQTRMFLGFPEETENYCLRAFELSPLEPLRAVWLRSRGLAALFLGNADAAALDAQAAVAINHEYPSGYVLLAAAESRRGNLVSAQDALARLSAVSHFRTIADVREFQARPRRDRFSACLEKMLHDLRAAGMPD